MLNKMLKKLAPALMVLLPACSAETPAPAPLASDVLNKRYSTPLAPPDKPLSVYYIGHSLIGRDIPAMIQQLAGAGHRYEVQLGWGTTLKAHWDPKTTPINGFERENNHPRFRAAHEAVESGEYDALVLTEMVEIKDAIKYFQSWDYLSRWAQRGWEKNPQLRVYLYETWHPIDGKEDWLMRLDRDLTQFWEGEILSRAMAADEKQRTIYVIPAGQVFARFVREIEQRGGMDGLTDRASLFAVEADGKQDPIHVNDLGAYLVALTHYAVLYHRSPVGLPHALHRADGSAATAPSEAVARLMQDIVWEVVTHYAKTGVRQAGNQD